MNIKEFFIESILNKSLNDLLVFQKYLNEIIEFQAKYADTLGNTDGLMLSYELYSNIENTINTFYRDQRVL